jgi:uncharacterized protein RhaS with RHS repeats
MRNWCYDPASGRFTQEDPIGLAGGMNLYSFANGDPVNFTDPFGLRAGCCKEAWNAIREAARSWWRDATDWDQAQEFLEATAFVPVVGAVGKVGVVAEEVGAAGRATAGLVGRIGSKIGRITSHLTRRDLSAAARELRGVQTGWDHVTEVREAAQGLRNQIDRLNRLLGNPNLSETNRAALEGLLGRASRTLDAAEQALRQ